jgi:hypothetical protein
MNRTLVVLIITFCASACIAQSAPSSNQNDPKVEVKSDAKPDVKPDVKNDAKPEAKTEVKTEIPADPKVVAQRELQSVRTVFVKGNSETSNALREKMETYSCLQPAINEKKADAVMDVDEAARRSDSLFGGHSNKISSSVTITMPNGDVVWSKNKLGDEGLIHSGAGGAAVGILRTLAKEACPGWSLRNEGKAGTPFHKDYVRTN